jgi:ABC-2 type transport system ATP-binding protein
MLRGYSVPTDRRLEQLSKGMVRRVQLVMALAHRPSVLLLDEPTDGLDPAVRDETLALLAGHLAETPTTVLVATHHVGELERLADHVGVLREGRLSVQMPVDALRRELVRYRLTIPDRWSEPPLEGAVLHRVQRGGEGLWTVRGEPSRVVERFAASGAAVIDRTPLPLEEAVLTLIRERE